MTLVLFPYAAIYEIGPTQDSPFSLGMGCDFTKNLRLEDKSSK
jgi:hypothetical protein